MTNPSKDTAGLPSELILVAHPDAQLQMHGGQVHSAAMGIAHLQKALTDTGAQVRPLFGPSESRIQARRRETPWAMPDLSTYYRVETASTEYEAVAAVLRAVAGVAGAYVKAPAVLPEEFAEPHPDAAGAPLAAVSPDLSGQQTYLDAAPGGVGARSSWTTTGGDGHGVQVAIVGGGWQLGHEDLAAAALGTIGGGIPIDSPSFRNHGTATLGVIRADRNSIGVTGVAPGCTARVVATFGLGTAAAIRAAADALPPGGVICIEFQRPGPGATGVGSAGFLPLEWWPDDFAAIAYATAKQVIVVEPAGNGSVSLDDPLYNTPAPGFPASWKNPFNRAIADCGAILVGAGAPPDPTHGRSWGPDRSRLPFSNYGASVDAQSYGREITTLGFGDLQGGPTENIWYSNVFGGTSGAAAIVAGVLADLQGAQLAGPKRPPLTPADMRRLLRQSGSAQTAGPDGPASAHPIGKRPDLVALIASLVVAKDESKDSKDTKEGKDNKDVKDKEGKDNKDNKDVKDNKDGPDNKRDKDAADKNHAKDAKDAKDEGDEKDFGKDARDKGGQRFGSGKEAPDAPKPAESSAHDGQSVLGLAPPVENTEPVRHFISAALRPELIASSLLREPEFLGCDPAELARRLRPPAEAADVLEPVAP